MDAEMQRGGGMTPLVQEAVRYAPEPETAMWFDVGQMEPTVDTNVQANILLQLPFPRTGIVGIDTTGRKFSLWLQAGDKNVTVAGCALQPVRYFEPFAYILTDDGMRYYNGGREVSAESILPAFRMVAATLLKLQKASSGYRGTPRANSLSNKLRIAKGKPPLQFDWHTVEIKPAQPKVEHKGGTHASPRLHDRRGHFRTLKTGATVWVKACKVGSAAAGAVFKDYTLKEAA